MFSLGIDSVEISRIAKLAENHRFFQRFFGSQELLQLKRRGFSVESVAVNFCAKEAFLKCMGVGLWVFLLKEIELLRQDSGQPYLKFSGKTLESVSEKKLKFLVSATHTRTLATVVIAAEICE